MNGEMEEAQKGCANLEEIEESTFVRFIEWAYQGYYTPGEFFERSSDNSSTGKRSQDETHNSGIRYELPPKEFEMPVTILEDEGVIRESFGTYKKKKKGSKALGGEPEILEPTLSVPPPLMSIKYELKNSFICRN